ncbi:hypothetical protein [Kitasatospora sp. NPDC088783]|uniref:hypothetical protein n=1 Tax=Kitasatospora sp. NPDC088783 TaxID=3364077 RepID=UPI0038278AEA
MIRRLAARAASVCAALVLVGPGPGATPAAATALPIEQCTTTSGVVLAVDFSHWGGPLLRSCGTTPTTGYQLLNQGGWKTTGTQHDGPAFICRIGYSGHQGGTQYPTPAQEKCVLTPPATAYWSYWHADPGQNTWSYSQLGAMSHHPAPGSVDLWIFGGTDLDGTEGRPAFSPDTVRAHNTAPGGTTRTAAPEPTPPVAGGSSGGGSTGGGTGNGTGTGGSSGGGTAASRPSADGPGAEQPETQASPAAPSATAPDSAAAPRPPADSPPPPSGAPSAESGRPVAVDAAPAADAPHPSSGSIAPAVTGAALVVALGAATAVTALRRRRRAE